MSTPSQPLDLHARAAPQREGLLGLSAWEECLRGAVPARTAEAIALSVAVRTGSRHLRDRHERAALAAGLTREEIDALVSGMVSRIASLSEEETAAAALGRCAIDGFGRGCEPAFLRLSRLIGEPAAIACLMLATCAMAQATMANVWSLGTSL